MIIKGVLPATGTLLCIQHITSFASLVRASARVESLMRSEHFPALFALARQANTSNRRSSNNSNNSSPDCSEQLTEAYADPPEEPAYAESQPDPFPLEHAPNYAPAAHTATVEPVHHVAPARQGLQLGQRRPRPAECDYTPLPEPLSVIFPQVESLLRLLAVHPSPNLPPWWHDTYQFYSFHRAMGHSTDDYLTLRDAV